ncbi:hypothetical protein [Nitrospina watsonii]|uniref:Uncharacterized protein n=1 Tax=Nitrospina watsonii TaxID=1323948 RepID=A0ABM9HCP5_9BACT|nr:hypothetical protein [Nitrospina watsonii]CAI2717952.1 conserved membrane protein of unknown function [Nitrospina watsonii]
MDEWKPWIGGGLLIGLFLLFAVVNAAVFYKGVIRKEKVGSGVPFLGGLFGMIGFLTLPVPILHKLYLAPLFLDIGCVPGLFIFLISKMFSSGK